MLEGAQDIGGLRGQVPPATGAQVGAAVTGSLGGATIVKMPTMSELVADMQEEVGFAHAERREHDKVEEESVEDRRRHMGEVLVLRVRESFADENRPAEEKIRSVRDKLRDGSIRNQSELFAALEEATSDKGEALALLLCVGEEAGSLPAAAKRILSGAAEAYAQTHASAVASSVNTLSLSQAAARESGLEVERLQAFYQDAVTDYEGILPALVSLTDRVGVSHFDAAHDFLFRAGEADLSAERGSSVQPERLKRILSELQGIKVFNSVRARAESLLERHGPRNGTIAGFGRDGLTGSLLHVAHDPGALGPQVLSPLEGEPEGDRLLFLQDIRNAVRTLPDYLYRTPDEKARVVFPIQTAVDALVFGEEEK